MNAADPMMVIQQSLLAIAYAFWFVFNLGLFIFVALVTLTFAGSYIDRFGDWLFRRKPH